MVAQKPEFNFYNGSTDTAGDYPVQITCSRTSKECTHRNGWYGSLKFWIFSRRFFMCTDCGNVEEI